MSRSISRFGPNDPSADVVAEIRKSGVAIVEDVFATAAIETLRRRVEVELDKSEPGGGELFGDAKRSISALLARGVEFSETLLLNERVLELMDAVLLPECPMAASSARRPPAAVGTGDHRRWHCRRSFATGNAAPVDRRPPADHVGDR